MVRPSNLVRDQHCQIATSVADLLNVVHGGDRSVGISLLAVSDESKSTAAAGVTVLDDDLRNQMD
jgi:hypothetical protein